MTLTRWLMRFTLLAVFLTYCVIGIGAFTRLSNAGLGCPDWPACYGKLIVSQPTVGAQINIQKAQIEMGHRYIAGALGAVILLVAVLTAMISSDKGRQFLVYSIGLIALLIYQVLLGMWTVTLKLSPFIVMQHLFVGLAILSLLCLIYLSLREKKIAPPRVFVGKKLVAFAWICFLLLFLQIILGGWTSSHYAGLLYQGISAIHRWSALVVSAAFLCLFFCIRMQSTYYLLALLCVQILLGALNVIFQLPLSIAVAHNLTAAAMMLMMVTIIFNLHASRKAMT